MNIGDTVILAEDFVVEPVYFHGDRNLVEVTFERKYNDIVLVSKNGKEHTVSADAVFSNMREAVNACVLRAELKASKLESEADEMRQLANYWLRKLEDFN